MDLSLFIDIENRVLVSSFTSTAGVALPFLFAGDTVNLSMRFLKPTGNPSAPYTDASLSGAAITVAIGHLNRRPTSGYFTLVDTDAGQTTQSLSYNAPAATVQAAVQSALTNWSAATVLGHVGGPYTVTNGVTGSQTPLVGSAFSLLHRPPSSSMRCRLAPMTFRP